MKIKIFDKDVFDLQEIKRFGQSFMFYIVYSLILAADIFIYSFLVVINSNKPLQANFSWKTA